MRSVAFCTLGCKVNQYETDAMEEIFLKAGYEIKDFHEKVDIYVINIDFGYLIIAEIFNIICFEGR